MKRIGLLGGMSWESSAEYYRLINEATRDRCGGLHSSECLLRSIDFAEIEQLQREGDWNRAGEQLAREAVAISQQTDGLTFQGDALYDLAEVLLQAGGRSQEAAAALEEALERYEQKRNLAMANRVRARLDELRSSPLSAR